jgi:translation initiation factor 3 subunit D
LTFEKTNPFQASVGGYRYRKWQLEDGITLVARCELDGTKGNNQHLIIRALNEYDPKATNIDWRQKLDTQRGAVLATELKNNSAKLARWTTQALLSGAHELCLGFVFSIFNIMTFNSKVSLISFFL